MAKRKGKTKSKKAKQKVSKTADAQIIENWGLEYDFRTDTFDLWVHWQGAGMNFVVPATSVAGLVEMFESVERKGIA